MFSFLSSLFGNPALLGGAMAGSIPIIIHLLNKQRFKKVIWGAMHWLWASYQKSRRRLQIEQLILLLIRVLVLVLLAFALARPALQEGIGLLSGRSSVHRVILIDNSYSMGQLVGGNPLFARAKQMAVELVEKLSLSDEVDVLLANSSSDDLIATSNTTRQDLINQIKTAQLSDGGTDLPKSIAAACRLLNDRKSKFRREIILITDETRTGWERADNQPRIISGDDEAAISKAFGDARGRPRIMIARLRGGKDLENLTAGRLEVDEKVVPTGVDTQLIGTVYNYSNTAAKNVRVKLKVNGEEAASELIGSISREKPETVAFYHSFPEAGSHTVSIELESDALPADNSAFLALDVENQMRVLCVDGQQRVGPNSSEMDYFRQALAPSKSEEIRSGKMPLYPEVISDSAFPEANLDHYRLIVLGNVALIPQEKVQALTNFVKRGGALWIFAGDRVDPSIYNKDLAELLPMPLGELVGTADPDGPKESIGEKETEHPAVAKFKGIKGLTLSHLQVYRRFKFVTAAQTDPAVRTVLAYESGEPAIVEKRIGNGRVMLVGTTADKGWNNWPTKNHYMPLMNFIALDLIQPAYIERNRMFGEKFVMQLPRNDLGAVRREGLRLTDPTGEASNMEILTEQFMAESAQIRRAGVYSAEVPGERKRTVHFAANRMTEESDLTPFEDRELLSYIPAETDARKDKPAFFGTIVTQNDIRLAGEDVKSVEEALKKTSGNREIWRWLAATVLCLLLVESFLARRFGDFTR
ncbi:MAG TPA: BatA domain-containing protein [Planctomycetota bacterium]|nr:BatA domain-containing protein [Planctomycetota bacterium]